MFKKSLLLALPLLCSVAFAQVKKSQDTTIRRDSTIADLHDAMADAAPVISLDENDMGDGGSQNVASLLTAGRNPFYSAASYNFDAARFNLRGYEGDKFNTYMNGVQMDNVDNGFTPYGQWGGLNDVMRNRDVAYTLRYNTFAFGDIGSSTMIDSRASKQRKQSSFSYALSNRNYRHRWMATHSTGMNQRGWAFTVSGSRRWADEGYVPGTFYNGWSYFVGMDKRIGQNHLLSVVSFGAPTISGRQAASTQEMFDLAGTNRYNPSWGYQNGKKRNASVANSHQPTIILSHDFKINPTTNLLTAVGYTFGNRNVTALDWYNAPDPRPDYYRYLPSYYKDDVYQYNQLYSEFKRDENIRQINWRDLYDANRNNNITVYDNNGNALATGKRSVYVIENRMVKTNRINASTVINKSLRGNIDFTGGLSYQRQTNNYYKQVDDLLGGDFYLNKNQFAERDFPNNPAAAQNDADNPNRILHVGDKFGYDYQLTTSRAAEWAQGVFRYNKVDFYVAGEYSITAFYRTGLVRTGLFPNNSLGKGNRNEFNNYAFKGGITYKLNGRNYFFANGYVGTRASFFENVYLSPRTRNSQVDKPKSETIQSAEAGYTMNAPSVKIHLSGYYTRFRDQMDMMSFFHDGYQSLVNLSLTGINKTHQGLELGIEWKTTPTLTMNAAAAVGQYIYDSRPMMTTTIDNSDSITAPQVVYLKNFKVPTGPQQAYTLGFTYRSPKYWTVGLTGNYFDQSWLSASPVRRTYEAINGVPYKSDMWNQTVAQEKFDPQYTVDFYGSYSWRLPRKYSIAKKTTYLVFNVGIDNILNNTNIKTGGYEQLRYDMVDKNVNKFPSKYYYGSGLSFFASATLRF